LVPLAELGVTLNAPKAAVLEELNTEPDPTIEPDRYEVPPTLDTTSFVADPPIEVNKPSTVNPGVPLAVVNACPYVEVPS
jgi:hypothetical protein